MDSSRWATGNTGQRALVLLPEFFGAVQALHKEEQKRKMLAKQQSILQHGDVAEEQPLTNDQR